MAIQTTLYITHANETLQTVKDRLLKQAGKPHEQAKAVSGFFNALNGGDRIGKFTAQVNSGDAVQASGTVTLASMVATDTVTIGKSVLTCVASGATGAQFNVGGNDTITAANIAALINSLPALQTVASATSSGVVVTVTSKSAGLIGNNIALAISAHGTVSAAFLAGGVDATSYSSTNTYHLGK